jgi:hypothetical protein
MELESKPDANIVSNLEHNQIFQSTYKEMRKINSNKMHANGYLVRYPTRKKLLSEDYRYKLQHEEALIKYKWQLEQLNKEREADRETLRLAILMDVDVSFIMYLSFCNY